MMQACQTYLTQHLATLLLADGQTRPYYPGTEQAPATNIFFDELPLDFLKDNDYAVSCLLLQDRSKPNGKLINKSRDLEAKTQTLQRRRFDREVVYRCLLYAKTAEDVWGAPGYVGMLEQLNQAIAENKWISGSDNAAIRVEPQDAARPWDTGVELDRKLRRPKLTIVRVLFSGGIQTTVTQDLIPSAQIVQIVGSSAGGSIVRDSGGMALFDAAGEVVRDSAGDSTGQQKYMVRDSTDGTVFDSIGGVVTDSAGI